MPRGHSPKRETKKLKKKAGKRIDVPPPAFTSPAVEVVGKRKKTREEES